MRRNRSRLATAGILALLCLLIPLSAIAETKLTVSGQDRKSVVRERV